MTIPLGVNKELDDALEDHRAYLNERGLDIILKINDETTVVRDKYNSIKKRTPSNITLHAFPVTFNPTDDEIREAGIRENVDVLVTVSTKDFDNNSLTYEGIDHTRWEIEIDGNLYSIKDKNQLNHFSHRYLNITMGLAKK